MESLTDILRSYIPQSVWQYRARRTASSDQPEIHSTTGAVLFADISGFTRLTEALVAQGSGGIEQLSRILNGYFDALLSVIAQHGGDVVKFAGDAILVFWSVNQTLALADQMQQASACAFAMQKQATTYQQAHQLQLALRIGLGTGTVTLGHLGSWQYGRELLVLGPAVLASINALQQAQAGEVLMSLAAWELIEDLAAGEQRAHHYRLIVPPDSLENQPLSWTTDILEQDLIAYLPQSMRERAKAGQSQWLAELRPVTVLFIELTKSTEASVLPWVHQAILAAQQILNHYEGSINKLSLDDKGISILAALGLPPQSHEDDAWRGIKVAQHLAVALQENHLTIAIGLTTGRAFCGEIGNNWRREYTLIGDVVNTAARLMQAAKQSQILCDQSTYQSTQERLAFTSLEPLELKGKREKVPVYIPGLATYQAAPETPETLLGRGAEQQQFAQWLQHSEQTATAISIVLEGEAGIGKSTLCQHWQQMAQQNGWQVLTGGADAIEKHSLYHLWRPVLMALWQIPLLTPTAEVRQVLESLATKAGEWAVWWPLLNMVMGTDLPDNETTFQLQGELRSANTLRLLLHLLQEAASQKPLALFLEDAHWFDSASWNLIEQVYQHIKPLTLVLTTRPWREVTPDLQPHFLQAPDLQWVRLGALNAEEVQRLLQIRLGVTHLPTAVVDLIYQQAEGHPFFSEELAYALRDAGYLQINPPDCALAVTPEELAQLHLPQNVEGVITSRVDRLLPSQQLVLKVASVIGRIFPYRVLEASYPLAEDKPHLREHLVLLAQLDITPLQSHEQELIYWFRHNLTHQVVYRLMLAEQRQQLHQVVATWYESSQSDLAPFYALLAYHWKNADVPEKYLGYLSLAAAQALDSGGYREAQVFALQGWERAEQAPQQAGFAHQLGEAYYGVGALGAAQQHLEKAVSLYGYSLPNELLIKKAIGQQVKKQLRYRLWPPPFKQWATDERAHLLHVAAAFERLGQIYYLQQDKMRGLYNALVILNLCEQAGPSPQLAQAYANICLISGIMGIRRIAENYKAKALQLVDQFTDNLAAQAWVLQITGLYELGTAQLPLAEQQLLQAIDLYQKLGDQRHQNESLGLLSMARFSQGAWSDSWHYSQQSMALAQQREDQNLICRAHITLSKILVYQGHGSQALAQINANLALAHAENRGLWLNLQAIGLLAMVRLGDWSGAEQWWQPLQKDGWLPGDSMTAFEIEWFSACCEYLLAHPQTNPKQSRLACQQLQKFAQRMIIGQPRYHLYQGWWYSQQNQTRQAQIHWLKAKKLAQQYQMNYESQWAKLWLQGNPQQPTLNWWSLVKA